MLLETVFVIWRYVMYHNVTFLPRGRTVSVPQGTSLLRAQIQAGLRPDAPCGGKGTCGKCRVYADGREILACQTAVMRDMVVSAADAGTAILTDGICVDILPDGKADYALAFDVGTTTVVCYLLDGHSGTLLAQTSAMNPQTQFGADVITRIQYALKDDRQDMTHCIRQTLRELAAEAAAKAGIPMETIGSAAIVGNTAMHHLLLGIDPTPLVKPPYMPNMCQATERGIARILPNIAGFVGGDTVGCMVATQFDRVAELTLMIDIGTNGEMVLGNRHRRITCSTAAGPAFEGAKISCGMRGAPGAVDHVWLEDGEVRYSVIGGGIAAGLCGSGLLDLVAVLLELGIINESGRLDGKSYRLGDTAVVLTQKDVREVQLAKAAIRAGIELLTQEMGTSIGEIRTVYLAGAFGNYMNPASACRIGMIPPVLLDRIHPIGNAAGQGARLCALRYEEFTHSQEMAAGTEFLELARLPQFQDLYVDALSFEDE